MDVSTMHRHLSQEWTIDEDGACADLIAQAQPLWVCTEHGGQPYTSWDNALVHLHSHHDPEYQAASNGAVPSGVPSDVTRVESSHAVELETPDAE